MIFRTLLHLLRSRRASRLDINDVGRVNMRVLPTDLDVLGHMNNGVYLSIMDLGRMDLLIRAGLWKTMRANGYYPVMANETISFRRSLQPWQPFVLETKVIGYDAKSTYVEQRFVVDGEIYASAITRGRFLKKGAGPVSTTELSALIGIDVTASAPPAWVSTWAAAVALPASRASAPSDWI